MTLDQATIDRIADAVVLRLAGVVSPSEQKARPGEDILHVIATQGAQAGVKFAGRKLKRVA